MENTEDSTETSVDDIEVPFIAELKVSNVKNGILRIEIKNLYDLLRRHGNQILVPKDRQFLIKFCFSMSHPKNNNNEWSTLVFDLNDMDLRERCFWLRLPIQLNAYELAFSICSRPNQSSDDWDEFCDEIHITVPSSMHEKTFEIGEDILFKAPNNELPYNGSVVGAINDDGFLEVAAHIRFADQCFPGGSLYGINLEIVVGLVHFDRMFADTISRQFVTDISGSQQSIIENLFLRCNHEEMRDYTFGVFRNLVACVWKSIGEELSVDSHGCEFVGVTVMDYLIEDCDRFDWKLQCPLDQNDGFIKKSRVCEKLFVMGIDPINGCIACDLCSVVMFDFSYMFHCESKSNNCHDLCVSCLNNVIMQNKQLQELLQDILTDSLNVDCIFSVVSFIVGTVIQI